MTTPYGVDGCRCDQGFTWDDREEIWHANPTCPYHGVLDASIVGVPVTGEFYVKDGVVRVVEESDWQDYADGSECYTIWVERKDDDD